LTKRFHPASIWRLGVVVVVVVGILAAAAAGLAPALDQ
jgi:hypothetical protein